MGWVRTTPRSNEAVEGKKLYTQMETAQKELDTKWEAAVGGIREELEM